MCTRVCVWPQDMVIKGSLEQLVLVETEAGRRRAGLPPRKPSNASTYSGPPQKASALLKNEVRSWSASLYVCCVCVHACTLAVICTPQCCTHFG
jgi:hypothetical protein